MLYPRFPALLWEGAGVDEPGASHADRCEEGGALAAEPEPGGVGAAGLGGAVSVPAEARVLVGHPESAGPVTRTPCGGD